MGKLALCLYNCIEMAEILLALLAVSRYVYLEPVLKNRKAQFIYGTAFFVFTFVVQMLPGIWEDIQITGILFFGVYIFLTRESHRIRGIFLLIPALGFLVGITALFYAVPYLVTGAYLPERENALLSDGIFWIVVLIFYIKGAGFRQRAAKESAYRQLGRWERNFLHGVGIFLFAVGSFLITIYEAGLSQDMSRFLTGLGCLSIVFLEVSAVALVQQGNKKGYFQYMTTIGEHYMRAELVHFRAYKEQEVRLRRFRHDIKNHRACLCRLSETGDLDRMITYLENLEGELRQTDHAVQTGNEIVDAILNEKLLLAQAMGVSFSLDGNFSCEIEMQAMDICTIFANALDNALEELERSSAAKMDRKEDGEQQNGWIRLKISCQGKMACFVFENPVCPQKKIMPPGCTDKKNEKEHGFGLLNIAYVAEKYHGSMKQQIREEKEGSVYSLEVLVFTE